MYKGHYTRFLRANQGRLLFTAHSHHAWPDVTREAHLQYWDDSAKLVDGKWRKVFGEIVPEAQSHIAHMLGLSRPENICFAPNTHEFVVRLLSCFEPGKPLRILSTDQEFYSFARQIKRYEELVNVSVTRVPLEPYDTFEQRMRTQLHNCEFDLVYVSHVFFLSGFAIKDLPAFVASVSNNNTLIVIDGYHSFCALPISLAEVEDRIFYLGGGYKYAQSGEGVCFMHVPAGCELRPLDTGWFASFETLEEQEASAGLPVSYSSNAFRFWGATFDPSGLYRFNAVMSWFQREDITVSQIHEHVKQLQAEFFTLMDRQQPPYLNRNSLILPDPNWHAHFLTFNVPSARAFSSRLEKFGVAVDIRGQYMRFGFGLYHDRSDIAAFYEKVKSLGA